MCLICNLYSNDSSILFSFTFNSEKLHNSENIFLLFVLFLDAIMKILRAGGNVLLPVDTAGRALELILHLDQVCSSFDIFLLISYSYLKASFLYCLCLCSTGLLKDLTIRSCS